MLQPKKVNFALWIWRTFSNVYRPNRPTLYHNIHIYGRDYDRVIPMRGNEFVILTDNEAERLLETIREEINKPEFPLWAEAEDLAFYLKRKPIE